MMTRFCKQVIIHNHRITFPEDIPHSQIVQRFHRWAEKWGIELGFVILEGKEVIWEEIVGKEKKK